MACPVGPKISPFSSAGVCARVLAARFRGLSRRMACTLSQRSPADDRVRARPDGSALVHRLADVHAVVEQLVEERLVDRLAALVRDALGASSATSFVAEPSFTNRSKMRRTSAASPSFTTSLRSRMS